MAFYDLIFYTKQKLMEQAIFQFMDKVFMLLILLSGED
jgi:hypothetical protein